MSNRAWNTTPGCRSKVRGLTWSRTLGVEGDGTRVAQDRLWIDAPVVSRASLVALRDRMVATPPEVLPVPAPSVVPEGTAAPDDRAQD